MPVESTAIEGCWLVRQQTHVDKRGFFRQTYVASELEQALGYVPRFVQGNHARSAPGVLRGFHAEPWDKLVYVTRGSVLAVVADIRPASPTFGQHVAVVLGDDADERVRLYIEEGLANAYCVLGDEPADYVYEVTAEWCPDVDKREVRFDDPTLGLPWPTAEPLVSEADRCAPTLRERFPDHPRFTGPTPTVPEP